MMTFALATAFFLGLAWLVVVAVAATVEEKSARIIDALAGRIPSTMGAVSPRFAVRYPVRRPQRAVMRPKMRAAA